MFFFLFFGGAGGGNEGGRFPAYVLCLCGTTPSGRLRPTHTECSRPQCGDSTLFSSHYVLIRGLYRGRGERDGRGDTGWRTARNCISIIVWKQNVIFETFGSLRWRLAGVSIKLCINCNSFAGRSACKILSHEIFENSLCFSFLHYLLCQVVTRHFAPHYLVTWPRTSTLPMCCKFSVFLKLWYIDQFKGL